MIDLGGRGNFISKKKQFVSRPKEVRDYREDPHSLIKLCEVESEYKKLDIVIILKKKKIMYK